MENEEEEGVEISILFNKNGINKYLVCIFNIV